MEKDRDSMLGQEEEGKGKAMGKNKEEDETEEQSDKRMSVDITSEKTDDKAPAGMTDSSADDELSDAEPRRSPPGLAENQPRSSRELGNVGSAAAGGSESTGANKTRETRQSWGVNEFLESFVSLLCEDKNVEGRSEGPVAESAELAQIRSPSTEARLASHRAFLESLKADNETDAAGPSETHEEQPSRWANKEDMLFSLKNEPHMQMQAVCALRRHAMTRHAPHKLLGTPWILDSTYAKLTKIAKFLMDDDVLGPCRRTSDELDAMYRGAAAYCSMHVSTYFTELYEIYLEGFDLYFP